MNRWAMIGAILCQVLLAVQIVSADGWKLLRNSTLPVIYAGSNPTCAGDQDLMAWAQTSPVVAGAWEVCSALTACTVLSNVQASTDDVDFGVSWNFPVTITGVSCAYSNGTPSPVPTLTLSDGDGNAMTITGTNPTCTTVTSEPAVAAVTAGGALIASETVLIDITNSPSPTTTSLRVCLYGRR